MPLRKDELSMTESLGYEALLSDWNMPGIALGFKLLQKYFGIQLKCNTFDTTGNIGKRYRRNDEIGTPFCITIDFETENDQSVTIRERDSMKQERIKISEIRKYIEDRIRL